ncbi:MAG TPA: ABC transporter permease [Opitutus sp.]|nr:ABC transporter permease [Opitutus sp.]
MRHALRSLAKSPGYTVVAILIVAIGIGAATAMFSTVNALVLRPLALPAPERLAVVYETNLSRNLSFFPVSIPNFVDWTQRATSWQSLAATGSRAMNLTGRGEPELEHVRLATASFLPTLGIPVTHGRNFTGAEDRPGGPHVAMLTTSYWQRQFGGKADVIGKTLTLDDAPYTIVGIVAPSTLFATEDDIVVPLAPDASRISRLDHDLTVYGRLKPGVSLAQADAELKTVAAQVWATARNTEPGWSTRLVPLAENEVGANIRHGLYVLLGAVGVLLLIACANLSNLLLVRASARAYEIAIRTALGATRWQLVRQLLVESLVITLAGGVVGVILALWAIAALHSVPLPRAAEISIDLRVLAVACAASVFTGLLAGVGPALRAARARPQEALKGRAPVSGHRSRLRDSMVVTQMALSLTLLVGAALLVRSFWRLLQVNPGFNPSHVLTVSLHPKNEDDVGFYDRVFARASALPGVTAIGLVTHPPLDGGNTSLNVHPVGPAAIPDDQSIQANWRVVDGDYFRALEIPLVRGRAFVGLTPAEARNAVVISSALAHALFGDASPLGRQVNLGNGNKPITIVGVVGDVRNRLGSEPAPAFYVSVHRFTYGPMTLVARGQGDPAPLVATLRNVIRDIDPAVPVFGVRTMDELRTDSLQQERLVIALLGGFAVTALVLAALGIYGVVAFMVQQRTREFGVRLAIGAQSADILRLVLGQGVRFVLAGTVLGLAGAFAAARVLGAMLYETPSTYVPSYLAAALILAAASLVATLLPALRATRISPTIALRAE